MKKTLFITIILVYMNATPIKAQIITTIAGNNIGGYLGDGGQATSAELALPTTVAFDATGNLYIADAFNNVIRKVNPSGIISTVAGNGFNAGLGYGYGGYSGDGGQATDAELNNPNSVTLDAAGNLYIADTYNNRIRKLNTSGVINTVVGTGYLGGTGYGGYTGDGGQADTAEINNPFGITFDAVGNLYIADTYNNCIRKVNTSGVISTIAGKGIAVSSGDGGQADSAGLYSPTGVTIDALGNLYIAESGAYRVRKVNTVGIISTFAGNGVHGYSGDGGAATSAELSFVFGLTIDPNGNLFFTDYDNNCIRKVDTTGIITTIAGNGINGFSGDGGLATLAELYAPMGVTYRDATCNLFIADTHNSCIRVITNNCAVSTGIDQLSENKNQIIVYPNPANNKVFIEQAKKEEIIKVVLTDVYGKEVFKTSKQTEFDISSLIDGVYFIQVNTKNNISTQKLIIRH